MNSLYWTACYTNVGAERKAQRGIEGLGRGTFLPTFVRGWVQVGGSCKLFERPLLNRYVLVGLASRDDPIWAQFADVDGVSKVLSEGGFPRRIGGDEVARMMMAHVMRTYNQIQVRQANGKFGRSRKRRRRPRHGKTHVAMCKST